MLTQLFEGATYEEFTEEQVIFQQSEKGNNKCYVVLNGRVGVYRKSENCTIVLDGQQQPKVNLKEVVYDGENHRVLSRLARFGELLAKLTYGRLFGETALMNDAPRNATLVCLSPRVQLMVFHKQALDSIKTFYSREFAARKQMMCTLIPELNYINSQLRVTQIIEYFKPKTFMSGAFMFREGATDGKIFLVQEGQVLLSRKVPMPKIGNKGKIVYHDVDSPITSLSGLGIVGEECLLDGGAYKYTVHVKSALLRGYVLECNGNFSDLQNFPLFSILIKGFQAKE